MDNYIFSDGSAAPYISSRQNGRVAAAAKLSDKKYREIDSSFLCEGVKLTMEAARYGRITETFIREDAAEEMTDTAAAARSAGAEVFVLASPAFEKISTEKSPQGIISVAKFPESHTVWDGEIPEGFVLMLDCVRDPGNLGTILRSACAFGIGTVVLSGCADLYGSRTVRAAMGAIFKLNIRTVRCGEDFIRAMNRTGRRTVAAALGTSSLVLGQQEKRRDDCVVIGNEGHGISAGILAECTHRMRIPMAENTESLNAAVAASVILWEYRDPTI